MNGLGIPVLRPRYEQRHQPSRQCCDRTPPERAGGEDDPSYRIKGDEPECRRMGGKFADAGQANLLGRPQSSRGKLTNAKLTIRALSSLGSSGQMPTTKWAPVCDTTPGLISIEP
jgi:hypothetical protein